MRSLTVTHDEIDDVDQSPPEISPSPAQLSTEKFIPQDQTDIVPPVRMFTNQDDAPTIKAKIQQFDDNIGKISPTILYYASNVLFDKGYKEKSALYFNLAYLRHSFDLHRAIPNPTSPGYFSIKRLHLKTSPKINQWLAKSGQKLNEIYSTVRDIDNKSGFHYRIGYTIIEEKPIEEWPKLHKAAQHKFFQQFDKYHGTINQYQTK